MEDCGYKEQKANIGLSFLRVWMCFQVVLCHFWHVENYSSSWMVYIQMRDYAVDVFMLMAWIFAEHNLKKKDVSYLKRRVTRLFVPLIGWAIIYYACYRISEILFDIEIVGGIDEMLWQMFTGHSYNVNPTMWYQTTLIGITLLFFCVFYFFSDRNSKILIITLGIVSLILQYTNINYRMFSELRYELKFPLGRFMEMLPYATCGILVSQYRVLDKIAKYVTKIWWLLVLVLFALLYMKSQYLLKVPMGFGYSGIWGIIISLILVILFYWAPIRHSDILDVITKYTMGIYCMHRLVGNFYCILFAKIGIPKGTFSLCILIYITCYIVSFVMAKIPIKFVRGLVE